MTKVYVITGGTGGMGKASAKLLGKKGALLLADVNEERLIATTEELKAEGIEQVDYQTIDVTDRAAVKALVQKAATMGELGAVIHTAGLSPTMADWKKIMEVNAVGTAYILDEFLEIAVPGAVAVCISSMSAHMVPPNPQLSELLKNPTAEGFIEQTEGMTKGDNGASYSISKVAVIEMVKDRAWDWGGKGARVVSISPGTINTAMGRQEAEQSDMMAVLLAHTPLRREGEATEIASVVDFLTSEAASYVTGIDLLVDGGTIANMARLRQAMGQ